MSEHWDNILERLNVLENTEANNEVVRIAVEQAKLTLEAGKARDAYIESLRCVLDYEKLTPEQGELIELAWKTEEEIQSLLSGNNLQKLQALRDWCANKIRFFFEHYDYYQNEINRLVEFFVENHKRLDENPRFSEIYKENERILSEYLIAQKEKPAKDE
jgi:predicted O-linked N-acetylglucosamine transferase (SPINDLY family)